jgi:acyl transferase domain-containing protein
VAILLAGLTRWGKARVRADAVAGHSLGELTALVVAGSVPEARAVGLARLYGELGERASHELGGGALLALVDAKPEQATRIAERRGVSVGAYNGPRQVVLSGRKERLREARGEAKREGFRARWLNIPAPFHSPDMPQTEWEAAVRGVALTRPRVPFHSGVTGEPLDDNEPVKDLRRLMVEGFVTTVCFATVLENLWRDGFRRYAVIGPTPQMLGGIVKATLDVDAELL